MKSFFLQFLPLLESVDSEKKYVLIPGSYRPPHKGHYAMFKYYSQLVKPSDDVIIVVSDPKKAQRLTSKGKAISAETAEKIIKLYCKDLPNVQTVISNAPVGFCYDFAKDLDSGTLIFGCSRKDDDLVRFRTVKKYVEQHYPQVYVIDPETTAVNVIKVSGTNISASDFRNSFGDREKMKTFLPDHLTDEEKEQVINSLLSN